MVAFAFEKLVVYQKAINFADRICQLTEQFPRRYGFLVDQLNRAALSIAAKVINYQSVGEPPCAISLTELLNLNLSPTSAASFPKMICLVLPDSRESFP